MESCHAHLDGDCYWEHCPQIRGGEPETTGRHCPLDVLPEENDGLGNCKERKNG